MLRSYDSQDSRHIIRWYQYLRNPHRFSKVQVNCDGVLELTPTQIAPPMKKMINRAIIVRKALGTVRRGSFASPAITVCV